MAKSPGSARWVWLILTAALGVIAFAVSRSSKSTGGADPARPPATAGVEHHFAKQISSAGVADLRSAAPNTNSLFTLVTPANAAVLTAALPAPAREIHYVQLNRTLITGKRSPFWLRPGAGRFELSLPDGTPVRIAIDSSEMLGADRFTSKGHIDGRPESRAIFAWSEGFLEMSLEDPTLGTFALRTANEAVSQFYQIDPTLVAPCGGVRQPAQEPRSPARAALTTPHQGGPQGDAPARAALENPQRAEVHVLMLYTRTVMPTLAGAPRVAALQSAFDLAIARVNTTFESSLITARLKLVGIAETRYDDENNSERTKVQDDALTALYKRADGKMDEIHALRDASGADIVCLALGRADDASSGLSFLLDRPGDNENADFAFSVVQYTAIAGTNVVPHEFGHVLGCAHDRENAQSGAGAYSFSYGYRFRGADGRQYHDIMSYPPGIELSYFSNPDVVLPAPVGVAIGIGEGKPGESNSALTIERNAFATAAYRLQTQRAVGAGSLINVATRAFVGTGDQVLIGGFVVQGPQPKQVLVRAAGPALAPFGVTNALSDPLLRIFAGPTLTAENDNWGSPVGADRAAAPGEIATAATLAGAFPWATGGNDAAVLLTLPAGAYTAIVEGARGTVGAGLVEAYEIGQAESRIIGLATRGYVDRQGKEMYAGFVVQGEAGTTKRVLVRVLGPTLARAPFNLPAPLEDPEMEIRNSAGEILILNDDWSTGAEGGATAENDFKPVVETYGEKQIVATGRAPSNRREPCVLVDLPPGGYSIVIRPYELRNSNPALDQPAQPGLAVVEVYEIGR